MIDGAAWLYWSSTSKTKDGEKVLCGILVAHVDDLLFCGNKEAELAFEKIGAELGFGSKEYDNFVWCSKRIRRAEDKTIRLSMEEYHRNLKPIFIPKNRLKDPDSPLTVPEAKQLRALLGSFQWLVAQLRWDMGFWVSSLQGEKPCIATIIKANQALKEFQIDPSFELVFRPVDPKTSGIMV